MGKKKAKDNWATMQLRHVALRVIYIGWNYMGLACLKGGRPSVEAELFKAMRGANLIPHGDTVPEEWRVGMSPTVVDEAYALAGFVRAGRTDAGVSSTDQVCSVYMRSSARGFGPESVGYIPPGTRPRPVFPHWSSSEAGRAAAAAGGDATAVDLSSLSADKLCMDGEVDYIAALNSRLPKDIRVAAWAPVPTTFSARWSATSRRYEYYFTRHDLDIEAMRRAASLLVGTHDFRNFCKIDINNAKTWVRTVTEVRVEPVAELLPDTDAVMAEAEAEGGPAAAAGARLALARAADHPLTQWRLSIRGNAFLWHQVRCMAAVLLLVGRGLEEPALVTQLLTLDDEAGGFASKPSYQMAPEYPLCLVECNYDNYRPVWRASPRAARAVAHWSAQGGGKHAVGAIIQRKCFAADLLPPSERASFASAEMDRPYSDLFRHGIRHIPFRERGREPSLETRLAEVGRELGAGVFDSRVANDGAAGCARANPDDIGGK